MSRADDLVLQHLLARLDAAELDAGLRGELGVQPGEVTEALLLLRLHGLLRGERRPSGLSGRLKTALAAQSRGRVREQVLSSIRVLPPPRRRQRLPPWVLAVAAAALLLIVVAAGWPFGLGARSGIGIVAGAWRFADGSRLTAGLLPRHALGTAGAAGVVLRWLDGSEAEVRAASELHLAGDDVVLVAGTVRCTVAPHPRAAPFTVRTPHATVEVLGTVFTVEVGSATTCRVERGVVAFSSGADTRRVEAGMVATSDALSAPAPAGWQLVWADEFAGSGGAPDAQRWRDWARPSGINGDVQRYLPGLARVVDGTLDIGARRDASGWTSTSLLAQQLLLKPGMRIELRARLPLAPGAWPLIWAVQPERWPAGPEVVLLTTNGNPPRLRASLRMDDFFAARNGQPVGAGFSVYTIAWTEAGLDLWRDGERVAAVTAPGGAAWREACAAGLRLAIELPVTAADARAEDEHHLQIDWVRVYRRGPDKE